MVSKNTKDSKAAGPRIAIIGAGIAGISFAIALKRKLGYENYVIYEKASDVGGTWRENTYPGCASDIPINLYSLSTDLKSDWDRTHGYQPQIHAYWKDLSVKHGVHAHIKFNSTVVSAEWDVSKQMYYIVTEHVGTGVKETTEAEILVSALGLLDRIRYPEIRGIETFKGTKFHVARWDHEADLKGKRVGVIGNGASAVQLIPSISEDPSVQITQFCRTPNWFVPVPFGQRVGPTFQWINKHIPLALRLSRLNAFIQNETVYWTVFGTTFMRSLLMKAAGGYIRSAAPAKYHDKLIPNYLIGCKRLLLDVGYLKSLHRPNVSLNWDDIQSITEDGVVTIQGDKVPLDVIVFATGYIADSFPVHIRGSNNAQTIQEYYEENGGPKAYLGTTVPGFPNLSIIAGPNTLPTHTSLIFVEECQIDYTIQLLRPILTGAASSVEVTPQATDAYNTKIHKRLAHSVFVSCVSWYRTGPKGDGKVFTIFPGSGVLFWWWLRSVNWGHYIVKRTSSEGWDGESGETISSRLSVALVGVAVVMWVMLNHAELFEIVSRVG